MSPGAAKALLAVTPVLIFDMGQVMPGAWLGRLNLKPRFHSPGRFWVGLPRRRRRNFLSVRQGLLDNPPRFGLGSHVRIVPTGSSHTLDVVSFSWQAIPLLHDHNRDLPLMKITFSSPA